MKAIFPQKEASDLATGTMYHMMQLCSGGNIGEFGKLIAICQYFTYRANTFLPL